MSTPSASAHRRRRLRAASCAARAGTRRRARVRGARAAQEHRPPAKPRTGAPARLAEPQPLHERARADAVHGLGHVLHVRRALRRGHGPRSRPASSITRGLGARGLPLRLARRRLVAGSAQRGRRNHRQPDAVAARDAVADEHAARGGLQASASTPTPAAKAAAARTRAATATTSRTSTRSRRGASTRSRSTSAAACARAWTRRPPTRRSTRRSCTTRATARCCCRSATSCSRGSSRPKCRACRTRRFSSYTFGPSSGNSWRTDTDVGVPGQRRHSARCCATSTPTPRSPKRPARATGTTRTTSAPTRGCPRRSSAASSACGRCSRRR